MSGASQGAGVPPRHFLDYVEVLFPILLTVGIIVVLLVYRSAILQYLPRLSSVGAFGFEVKFAALEDLWASVQSLPPDLRVRKTYQGADEPIDVSRDDAKRAVGRLAAMPDLVRGRLVLWVDDEPLNNLHEIIVLRRFGMTVLRAGSNERALAILEDAPGDFDLVISDVARQEQRDDGLALRGLLERAGVRVPIIYYVARLEAKGCPAGAFGITNRPDELLHLVADALERVRPVR